MLSLFYMLLLSPYLVCNTSMLSLSLAQTGNICSGELSVTHGMVLRKKKADPVKETTEMRLQICTFLCLSISI